jgi:uncharacterized protein YjiS (DUF1127 family)
MTYVAPTSTAADFRIGNPLAKLTSRLVAAIAAEIARRKARRAYLDLLERGDGTLRDIGVTRETIRRVLLECDVRT